MIFREDKTLCSTCSVYLTPENTYKNKRGFRGLDSKCKPCKIKYTTNWNKENDRTEIVRRDNHKRQAQRNAHTASRRRMISQIHLTDGEQMFVNEYYKVASELTAAGTKHHVDHIIPLSKGGLHAPWNLQVLTATENLSKGSKL